MYSTVWSRFYIYPRYVYPDMRLNKGNTKYKVIDMMLNAYSQTVSKYSWLRDRHHIKCPRHIYRAWIRSRDRRIYHIQRDNARFSTRFSVGCWVQTNNKYVRVIKSNDNQAMPTLGRSVSPCGCVANPLLQAHVVYIRHEYPLIIGLD